MSSTVLVPQMARSVDSTLSRMCKKCMTPKPVGDFAERSDMPGHYRHQCRECTRKRSAVQNAAYRLILKCSECGGPRSFTSGSLCKHCYALKVLSKPLNICAECNQPCSRLHGVKRCRRCVSASALARRERVKAAKRPRQTIRFTRLAILQRRRNVRVYKGQLRKELINQFWRPLALKLREEMKIWQRAEKLRAAEWKYDPTLGSEHRVFKKRLRRKLFRRKRIEELQKRITRTYQLAELRAQEQNKAAERRYARQCNKELRENFINAIKLDSKLFRGWKDRYDRTAADTRTPLSELIAKEDHEEAEANHKLDLYAKNRDRRVEFATTDFAAQRLAKIAATAPLPKRRRGKMQSRITRYSPERGVTQRHIKMSSGQFV